MLPDFLIGSSGLGDHLTWSLEVDVMPSHFNACSPYCSEVEGAKSLLEACKTSAFHYEAPSTVRVEIVYGRG